MSPDLPLQDQPKLRRPRAAMGVEGCTKCIKYLLFVFNFVFWVSSHWERGALHGSQAGQRARPS